MKLYKIIIFMFASSLILAMLNSSGIFSGTMPTKTVSTMGSANITELTATDNVEGGTGIIDTIVGGAKFFASGIKMVISVVLTILTINTVLEQYGIPSYVITMLMQMLALIAIFGLIKFIMGRSDKGID